MILSENQELGTRNWELGIGDVELGTLSGLFDFGLTDTILFLCF
jgi:hypothetical protein